VTKTTKMLVGGPKSHNNKYNMADGRHFEEKIEKWPYLRNAA